MYRYIDKFNTANLTVWTVGLNNWADGAKLWEVKTNIIYKIKTDIQLLLSNVFTLQLLQQNCLVTKNRKLLSYWKDTGCKSL